MYAIYKQKKYDAELRLGKDVTLYSYEKDEGFENYVDPWGRESDTFFSQKMDIHELDYLYRIEYEIQYKGHFFDMMSAMKRKLIDKDLFCKTPLLYVKNEFNLEIGPILILALLALAREATYLSLYSAINTSALK